MEYVSKIANLQDYVFKDSYQYLELFIYTTVAFFLPIFLGHQQIVVGSVVNAMLVLCALNIKGMKLLPAIIAPSLGALVAGLLFGNLTMFLVYLLPFIWVGNAILVFSIKAFKLNMKKNYFVALGLGSLLKAGFLFGSAYVLYSLGLVPVVFLTAMGVLQLGTALIGGTGAYFVQLAKKKLY